jgi:TPR repeat protein
VVVEPEKRLKGSIIQTSVPKTGLFSALSLGTAAAANFKSAETEAERSSASALFNRACESDRQAFRDLYQAARRRAETSSSAATHSFSAYFLTTSCPIPQDAPGELHTDCNALAVPFYQKAAERGYPVFFDNLELMAFRGSHGMARDQVTGAEMMDRD